MIVVDRIEGNYAVVFFGEMRRDIPLSELPGEVHEGSVLKETPAGLVPDEAAEAERRKKMAERTRRVFGKK